MFHPRSATYIAVRAVVLLALAAGGLSAATAAVASTAGSTFSSVPVNYTCNLSGYSRSAAPLSLSASLGAPSTVSTGTDLTVEVVTASAQLPASLASSMPAISYIGAAGASQVTGGSVSLSGQSPQLGMAAGAMTEIPSITATGMVVPRSAGTAYAEAPRSLQLVPAHGSTKLASITCTATSVVKIQVAVTTVTSTVTSVATTPPATVMTSGKAPDTGTGSSLYATANLTLAAGGSAIVMAGIVIIGLALRRRRGRAAI